MQRTFETIARARVAARALLQSVAIAAIALLPCAAAHADTYLKSIATKQTDDGYVLDATFIAPVPPQLAYDVLTDFDHFAEFAPNVRTSRIAKRDGNRWVIEQTGVAKFGILVVPYTSQRQIDVTPPESIHSVQTQGSMKRLESLMTLKPDAAGTRMVYHIEIVPSAAAASILTPARLEHDIEGQFNALIGEMVKRRK